MNTYVLINNGNGDVFWSEKVTQASESDLQRLSSRFQNALSQKFIHGQVSMNFEQLDKYLHSYIDNLRTFLSENKTLLINRYGGFMFLTENISILKVIEADNFPNEENHIGLTGWLSPNAEFFPCEHGEHHKFAGFYEGNESHLFISLSSSPFDINSSSVFINENNITEKQKKWLMDNYNYLDEGQKSVLKSYELDFLKQEALL